MIFTIVDRVVSDNPLLQNNEPNHNATNYNHHQSFGDKNPRGWKHLLPKKAHLPPSEKYRNRCLELTGGRPESSKQHQQFSDTNPLERPESQIPSNESQFDIKPQRLNSVIVRNVLGKAGYVNQNLPPPQPQS